MRTGPAPRLSRIRPPDSVAAELIERRVVNAFSKVLRKCHGIPAGRVRVDKRSGYQTPCVETTPRTPFRLVPVFHQVWILRVIGPGQYRYSLTS